MAATIAKRRIGGWQTALADLAMILFLVAASAYRPEMSDAHRASETSYPTAAEILADEASKPETTREADDAPLPAPSIGVALAIFRPEMGISFEEWLEPHQSDPRKQLTVTAYYGPGQRRDAAARAIGLAEQTESFNGPVRILLEPASKSGLMASIGYDRSGAATLSSPAPLADSSAQQTGSDRNDQSQQNATDEARPAQPQIGDWEAQ